MIFCLFDGETLFPNESVTLGRGVGMESPDVIGGGVLCIKPWPEGVESILKLLGSICCSVPGGQLDDDGGSGIVASFLVVSSSLFVAA